MCVDTEEDLKLTNLIYSHFNDENMIAKEVGKFLDDNQEMGNINQDVVQKNV
ncbi:hypothetical protein [Clostridium botulinum]|uniref:hypothetical protein n=1 Tax=Clostridium botulinum TaxID=1491 RepID=UPI000AE6EAC3|nr:hypothetical protein [Clostridium botulinum]